MSQEENKNAPRRAQRSGGERQQRQTPRRRRRRGLGALGALIYVVAVIGAAVLLACLAWNWAGDVLALSKDAHSASITLPEDIFTTGERKVEVEQEQPDGTIKTVTETETVTIADIDYVAQVLEEIPVEALVVYPWPDEMRQTLEYRALEEASFSHGGPVNTVGPGDSLPLGETSLEVLGPLE